MNYVNVWSRDGLGGFYVPAEFAAELIEQGFAIISGNRIVMTTDQPFPSGRCPKCQKPWDDHVWDKQGPLCPKVATR